MIDAVTFGRAICRDCKRYVYIESQSRHNNYYACSKEPDENAPTESESSFNRAKTPQLTKRNCDLQINVGLHDYKDRNVITINNKQAQLLLLCSRSFITELRKEGVRQSSEGLWVED